MTTEDMFSKLWFAYPTDLCKNKRGGKQPAFQAFKKLKLDEDEFDRIMRNMAAQIRMDRQDKDAYRWPFVSTYLNQRRFDDVIESVQTVEKQESRICTVDSCNNPVHGNSYSVCSFHVPNNHDARLREAWLRTGINKSDPDYLDQCRAYVKERFKVLCR